MPRTRKHLTPYEAAATGWLTRSELRQQKLQPIRNAASKSVWQGRRSYDIFDPEATEPLASKPSPSVLARRQARDVARAWLAQSPLILDTETTGLGDDAEIVEIAVLDASGEVLFESLVRHEGDMSPAAAEVHGITPELLAGQPAWPDIHERVCELVAGRTVIMYGADFDARLLRQTAERHGLAMPDYRAECLMRLYAQWWQEKSRRRGQWRWQKLSNAGEQCGHATPNAHQARGDCETTLAVLHYVARGKFRRNSG